MSFRLVALVLLITTVLGSVARADPGPSGPAGKPSRTVEESLKTRALRERRDLLREVFEDRFKEYEKGPTSIALLQLASRHLGTSRRLLEVELALAGKPEDRAAACREHFDRMKKIERVDQERFEKGATPRRDWQQARAARLEAEALLFGATRGIGRDRR